MTQFTKVSDIVMTRPIPVFLPAPRGVEYCPECHSPIEEFSFGKVADRRDPYHPRYLDCPTCAPPAKQRRMAKKVAALMGESHIPYYAASWSFATMPATFSPSAVATAKRYANNKSVKRGLYLFGDLGAGKTSIAISIIKAVMERQEDAMFIRECDLIERLRAAVARETEDGDDLLRIAKSVRWLALDEVGLEKPTAFVLGLFYKLIEARRSLGLYTIFTSNHNLAALDAYWRPDGSAATEFHPGRRITDRIAEYCDGVHVAGPNQRRKQL